MDKKEKRVSKTQKVFEHLQKHGSITSLEAIRLYSATRLSSIIFNLRGRGHQIETINMPFTDETGFSSHYGKYILVE